jgi:hypothetical protein
MLEDRMNHRRLGDRRVIVESTRSLRLHRGHLRTSKRHVRFIITAQSRRLDQANSSPSLSRPQYATVLIVGSTTSTGSAATAATASLANTGASVGEGAGAATAEDAAAIGVGAADSPTPSAPLTADAARGMAGLAGANAFALPTRKRTRW